MKALIPPSNPKFPYVPSGWQLLCYYCNQEIDETEAEAGYNQRTIYPRGRWRHRTGQDRCCLYLIRPESEIDKPRCHVCGTQDDKHHGYCSAAGEPPYVATPFSQKEEEVEHWEGRNTMSEPEFIDALALASSISSITGGR